MLQGDAEEAALLRRRHAGGGDGDGDALQRDHLAHDPGGRVRRRGEDGVEPQGVGGDHLKRPEQRVRRRVAAGEEDAGPAEHGAEEREEGPGRREGEAEGRGHARVVHQEREGQHRRDGEQRLLQLLEHRAHDAHELPGGQADDEGRRERGEEA